MAIDLNDIQLRESLRERLRQRLRERALMRVPQAQPATNAPIPPMLSEHEPVVNPNANVNPFQNDFTPNTNTMSMRDIAGQVAPQSQQPFLERMARGAVSLPVGLAGLAEGMTTDPMSTLGSMGQAIAKHGKQTMDIGLTQFNPTAGYQALVERGQEYSTNPMLPAFDIAGAVGIGQGVSMLSKIGRKSAVPKIIADAVAPETPKLGDELGNKLGDGAGKISTETPKATPDAGATPAQSIKTAKAELRPVEKLEQAFTDKPSWKMTKEEIQNEYILSDNKDLPDFFLEHKKSGTNSSYGYGERAKRRFYDAPRKAVDNDPSWGENHLRMELERHHKVDIEDALSNGESVPPEVLADYPDLAAKYGKPDGGIELGALGTPETLNKFLTGTSELNQFWEALVERAKTRIGKAIPDKVKQAVHYDTGRPEAWEAAKLGRQQNISSGLEETLNLSKEGKGKFEQDQFGKAYDYLDPTERGIERPKDLTPEQADALDKIRNTQTKLTQEAVDLELIDPKVAEKNASTYLKRFYDKHEGKWDVAIQKAFSSFRIKGNKKRYLQTPEERMEAGIKRDPFYAFAKSAATQRHDIETARLLAKVADSPEFAKYVSDEVQPGFSTKRIPNSYQYGKLKNKFVSQSMYDDIMEIGRPFDQSEMSRLYGKLLGVWKAGKTAWNPATHGRNIFSSAIQNDLIAGLSPTRVDKYVDAIKGMIKGEEELKQFTSLGGREGTFNTAELQDFLGAIERGKGSMMNRGLDRMLDSKLAKPLKGMSELYQTEEIVFRYAAYKHRLSLGDSPAQAMKIAKKAIPDYNQVPSLIRKIRRSPIGAPFISYPYKMLPAIMDEAIKHPLRAGKYVVLFKAINEFAKNNLGMSDKEYDDLTKSKNFDGGSQILMPYKDKDGDPVILDLTYNMPFGDILEWGGAAGGTFGQGSSDTGLKDKALSMLSPVAKTGIEFLGNRNTYTGKDIVTKSMSKTDQAKAYGKHLYETAAPTFPSRGIPNIISAAMGEKGFGGKKKDLPTTVARNVFGVSLSPINPKVEKTGRAIDFKKVVEDYQRRIINAAIKKDKDELDKLIKEYQGYIKSQNK